MARVKRIWRSVLRHTLESESPPRYVALWLECGHRVMFLQRRGLRIGSPPAAIPPRVVCRACERASGG